MDYSQSTHGSSGTSQHSLVCGSIHTSQENKHLQHMGRCSSWGSPTFNGMDRLYWDAQPGCFRTRRDPLCMAISSLQCPQLETEGRLLQSWLSYDVRSQSRTVQTHDSQILSGADSTVCPGSCA